MVFPLVLLRFIRISWLSYVGVFLFFPFFFLSIFSNWVSFIIVLLFIYFFFACKVSQYFITKRNSVAVTSLFANEPCWLITNEYY